MLTVRQKTLNWTVLKQGEGTIKMQMWREKEWEGREEAQHDNDRLRMINQGGVEMSMGHDPYKAGYYTPHTPAWR